MTGRPKTSLLLVCALLLLSACGKKGPVRPLDLPLPGPVQQVELRQRGSELLLGWQLPAGNQDGSPLRGLAAIDIYRESYDPADDCPECKDRSTLLVAINPELPQPALRFGQNYLLIDRQVTPGQGYQYRLIPRTERGQQGQAVILRQPLATPVPPPAAPEVEAHDRSLELSWAAVTPGEGDELLGYQLYRSRGADPLPLTPVNPRPLEQPEFQDFNLENEQPYSYQLRSLVKRGELVLESEASQRVWGTPQAGF